MCARRAYQALEILGQASSATQMRNQIVYARGQLHIAITAWDEAYAGNTYRIEAGLLNEGGGGV